MMRVSHRLLSRWAEELQALIIRNNELREEE